MAKDMGIAFEGETLEDAYQKASSAFECSLIDLQSEVIQAPSNGFFGLFKKNAIIRVYECNKKEKEQKETINNNIQIKDISKEIDSIDEQVEKIQSKSKQSPKIFDDFYKNEDHPNDINLIEIEDKINDLFGMLEYELDPVRVKMYDEDTIYIEFNGADSALLIGKEGYRYKALSYILFNWIHEKYGKMIRLEIAQFLESQEQNMKKYLEPIIEIIKEEGYYKTKPFDGILVHIAVTQLREAFPHKYIAVKNNSNGEKYILVNEYKK